MRLPLLLLAVVAWAAPAWAQAQKPDRKPEATRAPAPPRAMPSAADVLRQLPDGTTHQFVMMPLRDGVKLATDVYVPKGQGPWPVVLLRTPYSRFDSRGHAAMEGAPCVVVCQNMRGRYGSEGTLPRETFDNEVDDSCDAVEWAAKQSWCNGRVGMWGPSGHGVAPSNAVWSNAPHLTAVTVNITGDNAYLYWVYDNGVRRKMYGWLGQRNMKVTDWPRPTTCLFDMAARKAFVAERAAKCQTAFQAKAGWFDLFSEAALDAFAALAGTGKCVVSVAPGGHGPIGGDLKYPSRNHVLKPVPRTFKQWMTEPDAAGPAQSVLSYYLMGDTMDPAAPGNVWKTSPKWPVDHAPTPFYLHKDGTLSLSPPAEAEASLSFQYDPKDPVPSLGGNYDLGTKSGPHDQRPLKDRKDVLRFVSEPLAEPLGITGKVLAELHVGSEAPDTLFTAKLIDIYPNGYEAVTRASAMMARYWQGLNKPAPLEKGKVYKLEMDLWSTALVFNKGHRIAVYVSSSDSPAYEVHPNQYEPVDSMDKAMATRNTVHLSAAHASKVILPVIAKESYLTPEGGK